MIGVAWVFEVLRSKQTKSAQRTAEDPVCVRVCMCFGGGDPSSPTAAHLVQLL